MLNSGLFSPCNCRCDGHHECVQSHYHHPPGVHLSCLIQCPWSKILKNYPVSIINWKAWWMTCELTVLRLEPICSDSFRVSDSAWFSSPNAYTEVNKFSDKCKNAHILHGHPFLLQATCTKTCGLLSSRYMIRFIQSLTFTCTACETQIVKITHDSLTFWYQFAPHVCHACSTLVLCYAVKIKGNLFRLTILAPWLLHTLC